MKKLLTILSVLTITTTGASSVVACSGKGHVTDNKKEVSQKIKEVLQEYTKDKPFKLSREEGNNKNRLIKDLKMILNLGSNSNIEVLDQDYHESNLKKINDQNEKVKVEPGVAMIVIKINNKEVYKDKIFWTTLQNGIVQESLEQFKTMQGELGGMVVKQTGKVTKKISDINANDIVNSFKARFNKTLNFKVNKINLLPSLRAPKNRTLDDKVINYGTINLECWVTTEKSKTTIYDGTINWVSESITDIVNANSILNKKGTSSNITNIDLPLPFPIPGLGIKTFGKLVTEVLPGLKQLLAKDDEVDKVYKSIGTNEFDKNWTEFLDFIINTSNTLLSKDKSVQDVFNKNISDLLPVPAGPAEIVIDGTVRDLLTNIAPSLISLLHWLLSNEFESHNVILELMQYLLSSVDKNVKKGIGDNWGEDSLFYKSTKTNLDALIYELLVGYKKDLNLSIKVGEEYLTDPKLLFSNEKDALKPTLLIIRFLNALSNLDGGLNLNKIDLNVGDNSLNAIVGLAIEKLLEPKIKELGNVILPAINSNIFDKVTTKLLQGNAKIMLKNKDDLWEELKDMFRGGTPDLSQFMAAKDFKVHLSNLQFELTSTIDENISVTTSDNLSFDFVFSDL
ncbi:lipoprotein [Spiroplasma chrysopicola]|uniref:MOLPALP family lipoprotein n=1 Tax=Spiroplasma chrysopicola DF-1 TaxID=1276227 RepID=R4UI71_9MOLU|nr:lipoprotein [Spiroplasma chrysopicola]AGM25011.1 hypothetical protein SCHRY_v1c04300 [Spiroplasma chrysopicola DF-1]